MDISAKFLREIAEFIIIKHATDIEYLSITEMTYDALDMQGFTSRQQDDIWRKVDSLINSAKVTVKFPEEEIDATS